MPSYSSMILVVAGNVSADLTTPALAASDLSVPVFTPLVVELEIEDEEGQDAKVLAVPEDRILSIYSHWQKPEDMNPLRLNQIQHFFEHYKDL